LRLGPFPISLHPTELYAHTGKNFKTHKHVVWSSPEPTKHTKKSTFKQVKAGCTDNLLRDSLEHLGEIQMIHKIVKTRLMASHRAVSGLIVKPLRSTINKTYERVSAFLS